MEAITLMIKKEEQTSEDRVRELHDFFMTYVVREMNK